jgi:hypothetical protein
VTALFGDELDTSVPPGFDFDYVDLDGLERRFSVDDGVLTTGSARYRLLHLGGASTRLTVRALRRIAELVDAGATVVGGRPTGSPSLADDDAEHARLCDRLWAGGVRATDLATAIDELGLVPWLSVDGGELLRIGRRIGDAEVVFLANPLPEPVTVTIRTADGTVPAAWDPVALTRTALDDGSRLSLPALGSVVLLPDPLARPARVDRSIPLDGEWSLYLPGVGDVPLPDGPRPWTELGHPGFAGTGTYRTEVEVPEPTDAVLVLGDVGDLARVRVNGVDCGVAWTPPFRVDVGAAFRPGVNVVEIDVATAWMNRLIAEAGSPTGGLFAPVAGVYAPDAPVRPAGLVGPVSLATDA